MNLAKEHYEERYGPCQWGTFLTALAIDFLDDIDALCVATRQDGQSDLWSTKCHNCGEEISMAVVGSLPDAYRTICPACGEGLIVQFVGGVD